MHLNKQNIYCIGDTHTLNYVHLLKTHNFKDFALIHVGDSGEGYPEYAFQDEIFLQRLYSYCEQNNGVILTTRGNHSNPRLYQPNHKYEKYSKYVKFIPDYTYISINDKTFLFAGGATSIDRTLNVEGETYWKDEVFKLPDNLSELRKCDYLITHSASIDAPPIDGFTRIQHYLDVDPPLRQELLDERNNIRKLVEHVKPKYSINGHFHQSSILYTDEVIYRGLAIEEVIDITS